MIGYRGKTGASEGLFISLVLPPTVVGFCCCWYLAKRMDVASIRVTVVFSWPATVITATVVFR